MIIQITCNKHSRAYRLYHRKSLKKLIFELCTYNLINTEFINWMNKKRRVEIRFANVSVVREISLMVPTPPPLNRFYRVDVFYIHLCVRTSRWNAIFWLHMFSLFGIRFSLYFFNLNSNKRLFFFFYSFSKSFSCFLQIIMNATNFHSIGYLKWW